VDDAVQLSIDGGHSGDSGRIGRTTGRGVAGNIRRHYPAWLLNLIVGLLLIANTINIGADLGAMGDALRLLIGGPHLLYVVLAGVSCVVLQIFVQYTRYVSVLKWLTLSLFAYFGTVMVVDIPWGEMIRGLFIPSLSASTAFWTSVVAIFGTTISPYLFFWQASQEVEDVETKSKRDPLKYAPHQAEKALERIRLDTYIGMAFSNLVAIAIIVTTAATLHPHGIANIQTSSEAAEALRPVAGRFAFSVFTLGILGTGLIAVPILAGSAAYAIGEARQWPTGLARQPLQARAFYATLAVATLVGVALNFTSFNPIQALFWSAVMVLPWANPNLTASAQYCQRTSKVLRKEHSSSAHRFRGREPSGMEQTRPVRLRQLARSRWMASFGINTLASARMIQS
jgi:Mn2+/Fe2+ NRAMP family transporter